MKLFTLAVIAMVIMNSFQTPTNEATQKLKAQNEKLQAQITKFETQNEALKKDITILKDKIKDKKK